MGTAAFIPAEAATKAIESWKSEAKTRRGRIPHDPVAETFAYCASDLEARIQVSTSRDVVSTGEYAAMNDVTDGTVRKWIKAGELEAHQDSSGDWKIARTAVRKKKRKART